VSDRRFLSQPVQPIDDRAPQERFPCAEVSLRPGPIVWKRLRDEVYRQMFRAEAGKPRAEIHLALALLHAWMRLEALPAENEQRQWLRTICPICVQMIEGLRSAKRSDAKKPKRVVGKKVPTKKRQGEKDGSQGTSYRKDKIPN
jgi:hypothetical protein